MENGPIEALQTVLRDNAQLNQENVDLRVLFAKIFALLLPFQQGDKVAVELKLGGAFSMRIDEHLSVSIRTRGLVERFTDIQTLADLAMQTETELKRRQGIGRKTIKELSEALGECGLRLGMKEDEIGQTELKQEQERWRQYRRISTLLDQLGWIREGDAVYLEYFDGVGEEVAWWGMGRYEGVSVEISDGKRKGVEFSAIKDIRKMPSRR